jgi:hypothetical protein
MTSRALHRPPDRIQVHLANDILEPVTFDVDEAARAEFADELPVPTPCRCG